MVFADSPAWARPRRGLTRTCFQVWLDRPILFTAAVIFALLLVPFSLVRIHQQSIDAFAMTSRTASISGLLGWGKTRQTTVLWKPLGLFESIGPHSDSLRKTHGLATVKPFYKQARYTSATDPHRDVTIFTMTTEDRLPLVKMLAEQYQGEIVLQS